MSCTKFFHKVKNKPMKYFFQKKQKCFMIHFIKCFKYCFILQKTSFQRMKVRHSFLCVKELIISSSLRIIMQLEIHIIILDPFYLTKECFSQLLSISNNQLSMQNILFNNIVKIILMENLLLFLNSFVITIKQIKIESSKKHLQPLL